jgi:hypothetical protein
LWLSFGLSFKTYCWAAFVFFVICKIPLLYCNAMSFLCWTFIMNCHGLCFFNYLGLCFFDYLGLCFKITLVYQPRCNSPWWLTESWGQRPYRPLPASVWENHSRVNKNKAIVRRIFFNPEIDFKQKNNWKYDLIFDLW